MTSHDSPGARVVRVETEVVATPEQVWEAVATGPGFAAWFVPAEVDGREGGEVVTHHGSFGSSRGVVTAWEPPHRFVYEERAWSQRDGAPPWATEILVEARAGGSCIVQLVSGFFTGGEGWEGELEGSDDGWRAAIEHLRIYFAHFPGQEAAWTRVQRRTTLPAAAAWDRLLTELEMTGLAVGQRRTAAVSAPPLAGVVEEAAPQRAMLRIDAPGPGIADLTVHSWGERTHVVLSASCYGAEGAEACAAIDAAWPAWLAERFPQEQAAG